MCQYQASRLMRIQPLLAQLGITMIAIGNGNQKWGETYKQTVPWKGEILIDTKSQTHKALGTKKFGFSALMGLARNKAIRPLYSKYGKQYTDYNNTGGSEANGLITGAVLAVEPGSNGEVIYTFREDNHPMAHWADEHAILRAFGWKGDLPELPEVERTADGKGDATPKVKLTAKAAKLLGLPAPDDEEEEEEKEEKGEEKKEEKTDSSAPTEASSDGSPTAASTDIVDAPAEDSSGTALAADDLPVSAADEALNVAATTEEGTV